MSSWWKRLKPGLGFDSFHLDPAYFPAATRDLLTVSEMKEFGALLLGYKSGRTLFGKTTILNIGLLQPEEKTIAQAVEKLAREKSGAEFSRVKIYRLVPEEFQRVLREVYGAKTSTRPKSSPTAVTSGRRLGRT